MKDKFKKLLNNEKFNDFAYDYMLETKESNGGGEVWSEEEIDLYNLEIEDIEAILQDWEERRK